MTFEGIDISHHQGIVDFEKVKNKAHKNFVILKAGGSDSKTGKQYKDKMFETYYKQAKKAGLNVGCYWFAGKSFRGKDDADYLYKNCLIGKEFEYPVFIDIEAQSLKNKYETTLQTRQFCFRIEMMGGYVGVYASDIYGFQERLDIERIKLFDFWVARYGTSPKYVKKYGIWQWFENGRIEGINGHDVDLDVSYINYPAIMEKHNLNRF